MKESILKAEKTLKEVHFKMSIEAKRILVTMCIFVAVVIYSSTAFAGRYLIPGESDYYSIIELKKAEPMAVIEGEGFLLSVGVHTGAITEVTLIIDNRSKKTLSLESLGVIFITNREVIEPVSPQEAAFIVRPYGKPLPPPPPPKQFVTNIKVHGRLNDYGYYTASGTATTTEVPEAPYHILRRKIKERHYKKKLKLEEEYTRDSFSSGFVLGGTMKSGKVFFPIKEGNIRGETEVRIYFGVDDYVSIPFYKEKPVGGSIRHGERLKKSFGGGEVQPSSPKPAVGESVSVYYTRYSKNEYNKRIKDYTAMIEYDPKNAESYFNRGIGYCDKGEYDKAIEDYTEAIRLNPKYADAYYTRGLTYNVKGDKEKAIKDFQKAADLGHKESEEILKREGIVEVKTDEGKEKNEEEKENVEDIPSRGPIIEGKVTEVNYTTSEVNINIGKREGINEGDILIIKRGEEEIGKILIINVRYTFSIGRIKEGKISRNDTVCVEFQP